MKIFSIKLWIIFSLCILDYCYSEDVLSGIQRLATKFDSAFSNLKQVLNSAKYNEKIVNIRKDPLSENEIRDILIKSKSDTENIISKTNKVVDNIQSVLTQSYVEYSKDQSKVYSIECPNPAFLYYYRAKAVKNDNVSEVINCISQKLPLEKDPFVDNVLTNRDTATAHVPTNVYDASQDIQTVSNWTGNLDETFRSARDDFQLKWQFFCSNTGLFKIFPGIRWNIQIEDSEKDSSLVDFFDCRSEQWYLEATSYPKKVMIMVDKSGSMKGRRKIIANHTVYEILNTLTENDYFNILLFTREYFFADNSTAGILMHATDKNKKFIIDQLVSVFVPDGIAEYDIGLNASFKVLRNDKKNDSDSRLYNYLLMIITDGSPSPYQELIEKNNMDVGARIFTYLIGQGATERDAVTKMACNNSGYAVEIATLADVKENVQKYLNVVARKNAILRNAFNVWTGVHQMQMQPNEELMPVNDSKPQQVSTTVNPNSFSVTFAPNVTTTFNTNYQFVTTMPSNDTSNAQQVMSTKIEIFKDKPIKLFVTSSKAAFDETNFSIQYHKGNLLGAAGVDIAISEFVKTAPFWKIGINAYLFGITSNGFVLFHPKFRPQYRKYVKYFYRNVDISELEVEADMVIDFIRNDQIVQSNDSFQLRTELLNQSPEAPVRQAGRIITHQIVDDFRTAFKIERTYFIAGIDKTSYKFGLAVPIGQKVPKYTDGTFQTISMETFATNLKMDYENFRNQCNIIYSNKNETGVTMKYHEFCNMNHHIATLHMKSPLCVLIDILTNETTLKQCVSKSEDAKIYINNMYSEIQMTADYPNFWAGINGLNLSVQQVFSMHHYGLIRYHNYDDLSYEHFIANHSLGIDDPMYQETILVAQNMKNDGIFVARPLPNEVVKKNLAPSSLVFTVTTPLVSNGVYVGIAGIQARHDFYQSILMENSICSNFSIRECFIITESGLILLNNQDIRINGNLLQEANCALMESLVHNKIFEEQSLYDFQGLCPNQVKPTDSFSMRLINPFTLFFRFSLWLIYELFITIQSFSLTTFMWSLSVQEELFDSVYTARPCYRKMRAVMQRSDSFVNESASGTIKLKQSEAKWFAKPIKNTNLLLVVLDKMNPACSCECSNLFGKEEELTRKVNNSIENPFRVYPSYIPSSINLSITVNNTVCTDGSPISSMRVRLLIVCSAVVAVFLAY